MSRRSAAPPINTTMVRQVRLNGPSVALDPRIHAYRTDVADIALADRVIAARYVEPDVLRCVVPAVMLRAGRNDEATATSALLHGETFRVVDTSGGWAWGACTHDGYVGWLRGDALAEVANMPTHRIGAAAALVFNRADIKSPVTAALPFNALVAASSVAGAFIAIDGGGFVHHRHLVAIDASLPDWVESASCFVGTPYLWGGRTRDGVDCSGLVQAALLAAGIACPRDSDQQCAEVGRPVGFESRQAGDLIFFPGHVGILASRDRLLHANAFWMTTLVESLATVIDRLAAHYAEPLLAIRRPERPI